MSAAGWKTRWEQITPLNKIEVFTAPDGREYRRAAAGRPADLEVPLRSRGLQPLRLRMFKRARVPA